MLLDGKDLGRVVMDYTVKDDAKLGMKVVKKIGFLWIVVSR